MTTRPRRPTGRITPRKSQGTQSEAERKFAASPPMPELPRSIDEAKQEIETMVQNINSTAQAIQNAQQQILAGNQRIAFLQGFIAAFEQGNNGKVQA